MGDETEIDYIWTQREEETTRAYQAFRVYLRLGPGRSLRKAAEAEGKTSDSQYMQWSSQHSWQERTRAYDMHMARAETDGMTSQIANVRDRHIEVADKLINHLDSRLDDYVAKRQDPSIRWIQAFATAAKVHAQAFAMRDADKTGELLETAADLIKRIEEAAGVNE